MPSISTDSLKEAYFLLFWYLLKQYINRLQFINKQKKIQICACLVGVRRNTKESSFTLSLSSMVINKNEPINIHKDVDFIFLNNEPINIHKDVDFISLNDLWLEIAKKAKEITMKKSATTKNISKEYTEKIFVILYKFSINIISKSRLYNCYVWPTH